MTTETVWTGLQHADWDKKAAPIGDIRDTLSGTHTLHLCWPGFPVKLMVGHFAHLISATLTEAVSTCEGEKVVSKTPQYP